MREEALHVTLAFLGYRPEKEIAAIADAVAITHDIDGQQQPHLVPSEVVGVPPRRPRLFALSLTDPDDEAARLQQAISDSLETNGFYKPEKRPFWPHVTLARVKRDRRAEPLPPDPPPLAPFRAAKVTLYRSVLRPQGAHYEALT